MRITFFVFSSAFTTIQLLLKGKPEHARVNLHLIEHGLWVVDTDRHQYVRTWDCVSDMVICSTGAPQGTVLVRFLVTLYTADFTNNSPSCHLQKFSDDSAIVGLITEDDDGSTED